MVVTVNRGSAPHRILAQLSGIQQTTSLVIAFCCEPRLASLIFREARRLNMLNGDWVWLALEQAVSDFHHHWTDGYSPVAAGRLPSGGWTADGQDDEDDWPLGLLGLVSQQPLRLTKHTMKGSLAIIHSSIRASLAVHQLQTWLDSWTNETSATHPIQRLQVAKKMDRYLTIDSGQSSTKGTQWHDVERRITITLLSSFRQLCVSVCVCRIPLFRSVY